MKLIIVLGLAVLAVKFARFAAILLVHAIAISLAIWYCRRSERLARALSTVRNRRDLVAMWTSDRAHRRLLARNLHLSIAMTAHFSAFPELSRRGSRVR